MATANVWMFTSDGDAAAALATNAEGRGAGSRVRIVGGFGGDGLCVEVIDGVEPRAGAVLRVAGRGMYRVLRDRRRWPHRRQLILAGWPREVDVRDPKINAVLVQAIQDIRGSSGHPR